MISGDLERIVGDYAQDAVFISHAGGLRGRDSVREGFVKIFEDLPDVQWDVRTRILEGDVYVDAYLPAQGDSLQSLTTAGSCFAVADVTKVFDFVEIPGFPQTDPDAYVKQSVFPGCFANGLPARKGAALAATQRPLAVGAITDQSGPPAWTTVRSWAIVGTASSLPLSSSSWPDGPTPTSPRSTHRTCQ